MSEPPIPSDPVFRVSGGMKVLVGIFLVPLILFLVGGILWSVFNGTVSPRDSAVLLITGFGFAAVFAGLIWTILMTGVEILPTEIRFDRGFRGAVDIPFERIAGYRSIRRKNNTTLAIVTKDAPHRRFLVPQTVGRRAELEDFIRCNFSDLDQADKDTDLAAALSDTQLGSTTDERRAALARAVTHARILNGSVYAAMLWAFAYPHPYAVAILALAVIPIAAVALAISSHGAISLYVMGKSVRPAVTYGFLVPPIGLAFRALKDWHIIGWSGFLVPFAILSGIMVAILWIASMSDPHRTLGAVLGLSVVCLAQSFGLVLFVNCYPDRSVPMIYRTEVISRHVTGGRSTTYYITVTPWLDGSRTRQISVSSSFYGSHSEGSVVLIGVRKGVLQMPWFFVQ